MARASRAALEPLELRYLLSSAVFAAPVTYAAGSNAGDTEQADFNGDGRLDFAVANLNGTTISVLWGAGDGTFTPGADIQIRAMALSSGDFNGDGKADLVIVDALNNIKLFMGRADGTFSAARTWGVGEMTTTFATGDFNRDGKLDLAATNGVTGNILIGYGKGDGSVQSTMELSAGPAGNLSGVAAGDFNGDGILDLAATFTNAVDIKFVRILTGNGTTFSPAGDFQTGTGPQAMVTGDFNGDGIADLAVADFWGDSVTILVGDGNGGFSATNYAVDARPHRITTADLNGDGDPDIITSSMPANGVSVLLGSAGATFASSAPYATGNGAYDVVAGDLNADGRPDLATANWYGNNVSVLLNSSTDNFAPQVLSIDAPTSLVIGDATLSYVLRDADSDLSSILVQWSTDGGATWSAATAASGGDGTTDLTTTPVGQSHTFVWASATDIPGSGPALVRITPTDSQAGIGAVAAVTIRNDNHAPVASVGISPPKPGTTATLTATATKSDADGDPVSLTFVWKVNGVTKRTFTSATALTDTFSLATTGNGDRGDVITVAVTPNDGLVNGSPATASATVADTAPVFSGVLSETVVAGTTTSIPPQHFMSRFSDVDAGDTLKKIMITTLPASGSLRLNGVNVVANQEIPVGQLGSLSYVAPSGNNITQSFKWKLSDGSLYSPVASTAFITITKLQPTAVVSWTTTPEVQYGQAVRVNAIVTSEGPVPTGNVQFVDADDSILGVFPLVNGQATGQISMARGYHQLTANYLGDGTYDGLVADRALPIHIGAQNVVDVLAIYTDAAEQQIAGYNANIEDVIYMAVADTNDAFVNSQINISLELSAVLPTTYTESGAMDTDLTRLATSSDGFMDNIFSLRNTYGADLVTLFVGNGDLAGIAYLMQNDLSNSDNADLAFSVILAEESIAPYYALAHELGHNFGAVHDRENADGPGYYYDSYGYRYTGTDGILYHDIMSYDPGEMIPYFANPNVSYKGRPTGNSGSNVARTLNATAPIVKQYEPTKVPLTTATSTTLTLSGTGGSTTITARVAELSANPHSPEGNVVFLDGNRQLGSITLSNGQATWSGALPQGIPHSIRAVYQADDFYGDSISAATVFAGDYVVEGTAAADVFSVTMNGSLLRVTLNSAIVEERAVADIGSLTLLGLGGNDRITVAGTVTKGLIIDGGDGNDTIVGGAGGDTLRGRAGSDSMLGNSGNDRIEGGDDADWASGGSGADTFLGGAGNDTVYGGPGADSLLGEGSNDLFWGGAGNDTINGGPGNDVAVGELDNDLLIGGDGNDTLAGSFGNDMLSGQAGMDVVLGNAGSDTLYGGIGTDSVDGAGEDDLLYGDEASGYLGDSDKVIGGDGNDTLHGGIGRDTMWGNAGNDALYGEGSIDQLWGGTGSDTLTGGEGSDSLLGEADDDWLYSEGDGATDFLRGDAGLDHSRRGPSDRLLDAIEDDVLGAA